MRLVDVREHGDVSAVAEILGRALVTLAEASPEHRQLVADEVQFVAVADLARPRAATGPRGYTTPLHGAERYDSDFLAARLVWAAVVLREDRLARQRGKASDWEAAGLRAAEAQRILLDRIPNGTRLREQLVL